MGVVSRLSWQKGLDLLLEVLPTLIGEGMQLALLGSGEAELEEKFLAAAEAYPGRSASASAIAKHSPIAFRLARTRCLCRRVSSHAA